VSNEIEKAEILRHVTHDDLLQYGLIPEFVGRLPVISTLMPLDLEMMTNILTQPKNAVLKQFQHMFRIDGVELQITDEGLTAVAEKALGQRTGARGLRTVLEQILMETMFEIPSRTDIKTCVITSETVVDNQRPLLMTASDTDAFEESKSA
jgi:ATP-dependent Clp protease ATP-binding subunit ClpX